MLSFLTEAQLRTSRRRLSVPLKKHHNSTLLAANETQLIYSELIPKELILMLSFHSLSGRFQVV